MLSLEDRVEELAEPIANNIDCEVVDVEYVSERGEQVLRVYIDALDGNITVEHFIILPLKKFTKTVIFLNSQNYPDLYTVEIN